MGHAHGSGRNRAVYHGNNGSLGRDTSHGNVLMGRSDTGLHDWILSVGYRSNLDDRKRRLCITGIAGKLRHRLTGIGINILSDGLIVAKITFQDILCIYDTF